jgi:hypothetical protein
LQMLDLIANRTLTQLPESILALQRSCLVSLWNCGLSPQVLRRLGEATQAANYNGPRFFYAMDNGDLYQVRPIEESLEILYNICQRELRAFPELMQDEAKRNQLASWLSRLNSMADFMKEGERQKSLAAHIIHYLELANYDPSFRGWFFTRIEDASGTCGDRMTLSILYLSVDAQLATIDRSNLKALSQLLLRGVFAIEQLATFAEAKIKTMRFVDEIEVYLAYPIMLKDTLELPIDVNDMLYGACAGLSKEELDAAGLAVRTTLDNLQLCAEFLIKDSLWMEALKAKYPHKYGVIEAEINKLRDQDEYGLNALNIQEIRTGRYCELTMHALRE